MKILGQSADMSHQPDRPSRASARSGAVSRDAGLLRIRALTKGAAVTAAFGSVALGLVLAHPAQAASAPAATTPGQSSGDAQAQAQPPSDDQQQLAPPAQPPADVAPQSPPQAVSGGS